MPRRTKAFLKVGLIGYIQRVLIMVVLSMLVSFIISLFIKADFKTVLRFSSYAVFLIGLLSVLGGSRTMHDPKYMGLKGFSESTDVTREDLKLLHGSQAFLIFMVISGIILYGIHLLF